MELILTNSDLSIPTEIANLQALKDELIPRVQKYSSLVVTEDGIQAAKKDKAALNKFKEVLESRRREIKAQCLEPYNVIEGQFKELVRLIDEPVQAIDRQIKYFDNLKKQEKYAALHEHFETVNRLDFLRLDDVLDPKWGNVSMKPDKLKEDITAKVSALANDYESIKAIYADSPLLMAILDRFAESRDKSAAIAYAALMEKQEQLRREREQDRQVRLQAVVKEPEETAGEAPEELHEAIPEPQAEPTGSISFRVTCTRSRLIGLRDYMKTNGIKFEVIRQEEI